VQTFASSRPRTVDEGAEDVLSVLLDQVIDISENPTHDGCGKMRWACGTGEVRKVSERSKLEETTLTCFD
jgi:hypothetical protein